MVTYQPCNIKLLISHLLVTIIRTTHIVDNLSRMCFTCNNIVQGGKIMNLNL